MRPVNASVAALSAVALWGLAFPLIQEGLAFASPVMLGFLRFAFASLMLLLVLTKMFSVEDIRRLLAREWKGLSVLAALYVAVPNIAQNIGLQSGTSSIACVIQSSGPVLTLMFAAVLLGERITRGKAVGTVIAMGGTVVLVTGGGMALSNDGFVSNLLLLVSAVSYGLAWVSAKRMLERNPPMLVIGLTIVIGTVLLGLAVPFEPGSMLDVDSWVVLDLVVLGVFCAGVSSVLYLTALRSEEVSRLAFFIYLMPVFASLFAWIIRGETVELMTVACAMVIVVGIAIATKGNGTERPGEAADEQEHPPPETATKK